MDENFSPFPIFLLGQNILNNYAFLIIADVTQSESGPFKPLNSMKTVLGHFWYSCDFHKVLPKGVSTQVDFTLHLEKLCERCPLFSEILHSYSYWFHSSVGICPGRWCNRKQFPVKGPLRRDASE